MAVRIKIKAPRIVQPGGARGRWFGLLIGILVLATLVWLAFDFGLDWAGYSQSSSVRIAKRLKQDLAAAEQQRDQLRQQVAALERSGQIDREANRLAREELKKQQDATLNLEKEVALLRNLLAEGSKGALKIQELKLSVTDEERVYSYKFTVSQVKKDFGMSEGQIEVSVEGMLDGQAKRLSQKDLEGDEADGHKMRFRYFQTISGRFRLPEGFLPDSLIVEVKPSVKKLMPLKEAFDWVVGG